MKNIKIIILCIITDNQQDSGKDRGKQIGLELASKIRKEKPSLPILIQSSEPIKKDKSIDKDIKFISKKAPNLIISSKRIFKRMFRSTRKLFSKTIKIKRYLEYKI